MHYYIDGYNLLFHMLRADDNLQEYRKEIIKDLHLKAKLLQIPLTIVFDSASQAGDWERSHYGDLEIYFTSQGQSADEFLLQLIKKSSSPENCVVITNDRELSLSIRRSGGKTESIGRFLSWINNRIKNKLQRGKKKKREEAPVKQEKHLSSEVPTVDAAVENCFDYYLSVFEKRLEEEPEIP